MKKIAMWVLILRIILAVAEALHRVLNDEASKKKEE